MPPTARTSPKRPAPRRLKCSSKWKPNWEKQASFSQGLIVICRYHFQFTLYRVVQRFAKRRAHHLFYKSDSVAMLVVPIVSFGRLYLYHRDARVTLALRKPGF